MVEYQKTLSDSAREYLGVRFRHRGRSRNGLDCAGLVWVAYRDISVVLPDFNLYGREPHKNGLVRHAIEALGQPTHTCPVRMSDLRCNDVIVIRYGKDPHHLAILGSHNYSGIEALTLIHASGWDNKVLEHRLTSDIVRDITHVFRMST